MYIAYHRIMYCDTIGIVSWVNAISGQASRFWSAYMGESVNKLTSDPLNIRDNTLYSM